MASLKWVKLSIELFADERISLLENEPQGERHLLLWFRLLLLAAKLNNGGAFILDGVSLTPRKIASIIKKKPSYVAGGMAVLCRNRLIFEENGLYFIPNWEKYQSEDKLERIREKDRIRKREAYRKAKEFSSDFSAENLQSLQPQNKNKKENKNIDNILLHNNPTFSYDEPTQPLSVSNDLCVDPNHSLPYMPPSRREVANPQGFDGGSSLPPALAQTVTAFCEGLTELNNPRETHTLLLTWLNSLKEKNRLPTTGALPLILEKLPTVAKESNLTFPGYLQEVICRGWNNFYPIPAFGKSRATPQKAKKTSYDIDELEAMI